MFTNKELDLPIRAVPDGLDQPVLQLLAVFKPYHANKIRL